MNGFRFSDLQRRQAALINVGRVAELDTDAARVRVEFGEILTDWLPWITARAGPDRTWWAPEVGEQVLILAPSGELAQAVVLGAIYRDAFPAPANAETLARYVFADGAVIEYDRAAHSLVATLPDEATTTLTSPGHVTVNASGGVTIDAGGGGVAITGDLSVTGKINATKNIASAASITAAANVSDSAGSLQAQRDAYKIHKHRDSQNETTTAPI